MVRFPMFTNDLKMKRNSSSFTITKRQVGKKTRRMKERMREQEREREREIKRKKEKEREKETSNERKYA